MLFLINIKQKLYIGHSSIHEYVCVCLYYRAQGLTQIRPIPKIFEKGFLKFFWGGRGVCWYFFLKNPSKLQKNSEKGGGANPKTPTLVWHPTTPTPPFFEKQYVHDSQRYPKNRNHPSSKFLDPPLSICWCNFNIKTQQISDEKRKVLFIKPLILF